MFGGCSMGSIVSESSRTLRLKYRSSTDAVIGLDQRDVEDVVVDVDADGLALAPLLLNLLSRGSEGCGSRRRGGSRSRREWQPARSGSRRVRRNHPAGDEYSESRSDE